MSNPDGRMPNLCVSAAAAFVEWCGRCALAVDRFNPPSPEPPALLFLNQQNSMLAKGLWAKANLAGPAVADALHEARSAVGIRAIGAGHLDAAVDTGHLRKPTMTLRELQCKKVSGGHLADEVVAR